ncbi:unnamed protein product, partial [marine sediment metagenome]
SDFAKNINISILIPGIIYDPFNFTIAENYLKYNIAELAPYTEKQVSFSFYVPNTAVISSTNISYSTPEHIQNLNSTILETHPNHVCFSAPIDYSTRVPYIKTIEIYFTASNLAPSIGEELNLSVHVKNNGLEGFNIQNLTISMNDQFGDLAQIVPIFLTLSLTVIMSPISTWFLSTDLIIKKLILPNINGFEEAI